jgi:hypothetical protein
MGKHHLQGSEHSVGKRLSSAPAAGEMMEARSLSTVANLISDVEAVSIAASCPALTVVIAAVVAIVAGAALPACQSLSLLS